MYDRREKNKKWTWEYISLRRKDRLQYIDLYVKKKLRKVTIVPHSDMYTYLYLYVFLRLHLYPIYE
jgi:hypothetical protein